MSDVSEAPPGLFDSAAPGDTVPDKMPAIAEASEVLPLLPSASLEICDLEGLGEDDPLNELTFSIFSEGLDSGMGKLESEAAHLSNKNDWKG